MKHVHGLRKEPVDVAESVNHASLVKSIISWINYHFNNHMYVIFSDTFSEIGTNKPVPINGYIPDIYAASLKNNEFIIGEAKTYFDVESKRSCEQYKAFLKHCSSNSNSFFILAVPWTMVNAAKSLIKFLKKQTNTEDVKVVFLEDMPE